MAPQPQPQPQANGKRSEDSPPPAMRRSHEETQPCPRCGHAMPALKGGSASICPNCGFKDSCCY
jgi:NADH pyrophosphatase NudC (nudix superfamily)